MTKYVSKFTAETKTNLHKTRYFPYHFFKRSSDGNLCEKFITTLKSLDEKNMIQLKIDGRHVN